jgi:hypothetical protein
VRRLIALVLAGVAVVAVLVLWPKAPQDPEDQIRALVVSCVEGIEKHNVSTLSDAIADDFHGPEGLGAREIRQVVAGQVLRDRETVAVFNPTLDVTLHSQDAAEFTGVFLFSRTKDLKPESIGSAYRIEAKLERRDGAWKIVSASYKPISWP